MDGKAASMFDLTGRVALVTGGAGLLGVSFATVLADAGASVAVVDLDGGAAERVSSTIADQLNATTCGLECDVTSSDSIRHVVDQVEDTLGEITILDNNAATKGPSLDAFLAPVETYSDQTWRDVMAVNLDGMFRVAREIGSRMARRSGGSIIQTSSIYGLRAPDQRVYEGSRFMGTAINTPAVYSASKAGVNGLTQYLATYWAEFGVRVNTLSPGGVFSGQNEEFVRRYSNRVPMARMAQPHEMNGAMLFLASDASSYVTGHNLVVDGGLSVW